MDSSAPALSQFRYDAFISYSRKDSEFARRLERELRGYRPPKDLPVPQRYLRIFRDEADFSGGEYHDSLDRNLKDAAKLIVICSPHSASSSYVTDEIRRFAQYRGKEHIVPILLDGIPNNEAHTGDAGLDAFPDELVRLLPIPLAADYRGFDPKVDKVRKGPFAPPWFKTLADLYADYGVDRAKIEQRERRREAQRLRTIATISSSVAIALIGLTIWALLSRNEATRQRDNSEARRNEAEARLVFDQSGDSLIKATLLSVASVRFTRTVDGQISLTRFASLLPRPPLWRQFLTESGQVLTGGRRKVLAYSPDGSRIASAGAGGPVQLLDARTGDIVAAFDAGPRTADRTVVAFSPDGAFLVAGCADQTCVFDVAAGRLLTRLPQGEARHGQMVWSASFSPDGTRLAMASYGSNEIIIYDVATWLTAATIQASGTVFSVAFSPDGEWLATGAPPGLQLWRVGQYDAPAVEVNAGGIVWSIAFRPDGDQIVAAVNVLQSWNIVSGDNGAVRLEAGAAVPIEAHTVLPVTWFGRSCFAAAAPDAVHLLCNESFEETLRVPLLSAAVAVSPDARWLLNEQSDGTLAAWPLDAALDTLRIALGSPIKSIASADPRGWLAAGTESGEVAVIGLDTWKEITRLRPGAPVTMVNASSDGRWLVATAGPSVHVFDAASWLEVAVTPYADRITWAGFDAEDRSLVVIAGTTVVVLEPGNWRERFRVEHDGRIEAVSFSPDGGRVATVTHWTAGHDSGVSLTRVFDVATGKETGWEYTSGSGNISEDFMREEAARSKRELAGGDALPVKESASWRVLELTEPGERLSTDAMWSAVADTGVTLTDVTAKRSIGSFGQTGRINTVRFVPAQAPRWIVSAGEDGAIGVWPVQAEDLAEEACARLSGILGAEGLQKVIMDVGAERSCQANE